MNSRERLLIAMTGGRPDRVPCTPDFSNMIPCRLTGKPFWDIYLHNDPPLWQAYIDAARYFGVDAWFFEGRLDFGYKNNVDYRSSIVSQDDERIVQHTVIGTPSGDMEAENTYYSADPPTPTVKAAKDLKEDFRKLRHMFAPPTSFTTDTARRQKLALGDDQAFGACVGYPGFQVWCVFVEGGVEPLAYAEMDNSEVLEEWRDVHERQVLKQTEMIIDSGMFDYLLLGASGSITLASPALFDKYALPTIKKVTAMCRQAGLPTMLHSCGKQEYLVKQCAQHTDLDCVNPLEIPPMGDCILADIKQRYGDKLALMGNLHTTEVMLKGSVEDVERAAKQCIDDAAAGGGFILSTGDQCGRDTPDENIFKLVEVCSTYGRYD